jgi:hypothetical protein
MSIKALLGVSLLALASLVSISFNQDDSITILYTANLNGVLRDCGCGQEKLGGIARLKTAIEHFRSQHAETYLIDAGDHLPSYKYPEKGREILKELSQLQYDFMLKADQDYLSGHLAEDAFYKNNKELFNYVVPETSFADSHLKNSEDSFLSDSPFLVYHGDSASYVNSRFADLPHQFVFLAHTQELHQSVWNGKLLMQAGVGSEFLGVLQVKKNGNNYELVNNQFFKLDSTVQEDIAVKQRIDTFFATQEHTNDVISKETQVYLGVENCAICHTKEAAAWEESNHAHAFQTLINENRAFDSDCLPCHTTGMGKGGFKNLAESKMFINVQCESCHTNLADQHQMAKNRLVRKKVDESTCITCHTSKNSPHFNYKSYLKKITHWKTPPSP